MSDFYKLSPDEQAVLYEELARLVLPEWGETDAQLSVIKMRENAVFKLISSNGDKKVLRIHRAGYHSNEALHSESLWIQALADSGVQTPRVIPTRKNDLFVVADSTLAGKPRQIDMFEWVDGEELGSLEEGVNTDHDTMLHNFRVIGELAASVHNQSSTWEIPGGFSRHAWDVDGITGDLPFWGRFWELDTLTSSQRELIVKVRGRLQKELSAFGQEKSRYSLIHADMVPENVLIDGKNVHLIDFDDAGFGWHMFELATALIFYTGTDYFNDIRDAYVEGYRSLRELSEDDLLQLPLFMMARATTYLGWVHTRRETETARELTPMIVELVMGIAEEYMSG